MPIYQNQEYLEITATVKQDITGSTARKILYIKPDRKTEGSWTATIVDASTGVIKATISDDGSTLNQDGDWYVKAQVTLQSGKTVEGKPQLMRVEQRWVKGND